MNNVRDYGAIGNGVADDTVAIQRAVDAFVGGHGVVYLPKGAYRTTSTICVQQDRVQILGDGKHVSQINFMPTLASDCLLFDKGTGTDLWQCSVRNLGFISTSTTSKTAIHASTVSEFTVEDVAVVTWRGAVDAPSTGLLTTGHEFVQCNRISINADRPLVIGPVPKPVSGMKLDADHFSFRDCYFTARNDQPVVTVLDNTNLTSVVFDGDQAWVAGSAGMVWERSGKTAGIGIQLAIRNVRWEPKVANAGYFLTLNHDYGFRGLTLDNILIGAKGQGLSLTNVYGVELQGVNYFGQRNGLVFNNVNNVHFASTFLQVCAGALFANTKWFRGAYVKGNEYVTW